MEEINWSNAPVGTACEYFTDGCGEAWCTAEVKYVGSHLIIVSYLHPNGAWYESCMNRTVESPPLSTRLRPAPTPEELAARVRAKAIDTMVDECGYDGGGASYYTCAGLYDAGYRKVQL